MRREVIIAIAIVAILIASVLAGYYLKSGPSPIRHDVILSGLTLSSEDVNQGDSLLIEVVVSNNGTVTETFNVSATYDGVLIGEQNVTSLMAGKNQTLTFNWDTSNVGGGNHNVTATVTPVLGQTDLNNTSKSANVQVIAPSLVYDFNGTTGVSLLNWNAFGHVTTNETDAVSIYWPSSISREFTAASSSVSISLDWSENLVMVVSRQLNDVYSNLTYPYVEISNSTYDNVSESVYTNAISFNVDEGSTFTVQFNASPYQTAFILRASLWASDEFQ
jgi:hypothetical protein